jgi:hypothetical protein
MMRGVTVTLPESARAKLSALEVARDLALDATRSCVARLSGLGRDFDPQLQARLAAERDRHAARHRALAGLIHKINEWLMGLRANTALEIAPTVDIKLREGETIFDAIEATRNQISSSQGQLAVIRAAPLPVEDQRQSVAAYVERLGRQARPVVSVVQNGTLRVGFRDVLIEAEQTLALLAWVAPDQVRDALIGVLEAQPRVVGAMPASERLQRVAEIEDKLTELEYAEEAMIEHAAKQGIDILRRVDASPPCVLGVAVKARVQVAQIVA